MGGDDPGPRGARALTTAYVLCVTAVFALSRVRYFGLSWTSAAYLAAVAPIVVLQVVLLGPRARPRLLLPALAAFTYLPFLVFGGIWIGLPAFLAGSFLITVRGRVRWALFAAAAASAAASGGAYGGGAGGIFYAVTSTLDVSLVLYAVSHLARMGARMHATRDELAAIAVTSERLRAGEDLDHLLGGGLSDIARRSAAAAERSPERMAAALPELVRTARDTLDGARSLAAAYRVQEAGAAADRREERRALWAMLLIAGGYLTSSAQYLAGAGAGPREWTLLLGGQALVLALQLHHMVLRLQARRMPYGYLAVQAAVVYSPILGGLQWYMTVGPLAASVLLLFRGRAAWAAAVLVLGSAPVIAVLDGAWPLTESLYLGVSQVTTTVAFFALVRLAEIAGDLRAVRARVARMAVYAERVRLAGDVHDLLGYGLSAITLKSELALRVLPGDPERARRELAEVAELARRSLAELRGVVNASGDLSLAAELASARATLTALGVRVAVEADPAPVRVEVDRTLAIVLREAVANVLRHSSPRRVAITVRTTPAAARIEITNDGPCGVPGSAASSPGAPAPGTAVSGGSGLRNLTVRVNDLGGHLTARPTPSSYTLEAEIPLDVLAQPVEP